MCDQVVGRTLLCPHHRACNWSSKNLLRIIYSVLIMVCLLAETSQGSPAVQKMNVAVTAEPFGTAKPSTNSKLQIGTKPAALRSAPPAASNSSANPKDTPHVTVTVVPSKAAVVAAWASAIAALFSGVVAFLTYRINTGNRLEAMRPDVIVYMERPELQRSGGSLGEALAGNAGLRVMNIKNFGKGPALDAHVRCVKIGDQQRAPNEGMKMVTIIPPGDEVAIDAEFNWNWDAFRDEIAVIVFVIDYTDAYGNPYAQELTVAAVNGTDVPSRAVAISRGLYSLKRTVVRVSNRNVEDIVAEGVDKRKENC